MEDPFSSNDCGEAVVDKRVKLFLNTESDDLEVLLGEVQHPERFTKFGIFWNEAEKFLNKDVKTAVDDQSMVKLHIQLKPFPFVISESRFKNVELQSPVMSGYDCSSDPPKPKTELLSVA